MLDSDDQISKWKLENDYVINQVLEAEGTQGKADGKINTNMYHLFVLPPILNFHNYIGQILVNSKKVDDPSEKEHMKLKRNTILAIHFDVKMFVCPLFYFTRTNIRGVSPNHTAKFSEL